MSDIIACHYSPTRLEVIYKITFINYLICRHERIRNRVKLALGLVQSFTLLRSKSQVAQMVRVPDLISEGPGLNS